MADTKISALPSSPATVADIIPVARGGANYAVSADTIADLVRDDLASTASGKGASLVSLENGQTVQDHFDTITGDDGAATVKAKRTAASTVPATVKSLLETRVSVREWGASGTSTASDHAKLQKAIDEAPLGSTLHFPGGVFFTTGLNVNRQLSISCDPGTLILGVGSDPNVDVINIKMPASATVEGSANAMNFHNLRAETAVGFNARATLNIESQSGVDAPLLNFSFFGGRIAARDAQAGPAVRIAGLTSKMHKFYSMDIVNQVLMDGCADANALIGCNIYSAKTGVVVDAVPGAFHTLIRDNVITSRDGAVWVKGGSKTKIFDNQIEQTGVNGHSQNAHIILEALSYSLMGLEVRGNNFGGSATDVARAIAMLTSGGRTIESAQIGFNTWGVTSTEDIKILDSGVRYTEIDPLQQFRGPRAGVTFTTYPAVTSNTVDALALLNVNDGGFGTGFVRKGAVALGGASATALLNSWTCSASTFFRRVGGSVEFAGWADGPAAAQNSVTIGTLPVGFRPAVEESFAVSGFDLGTGAMVSGLVQVLTDGSIVCTRPASTNVVRIGLSPLRFIAKRERYEPGY